MNRVKLWLVGFLGVVLLFLGACTTVGEKQAEILKPPVVAPGAEYVGTKTCLECHDDLSEDAKTNVHLRLANYEVPGGSVKGCEACHGPGSKHEEAMENDNTEAGLKAIIRFGKGKLEGKRASAVCLTCHSGGETMHYTFSAHFENDVACTDCHKIHGNKRKALLAKPEFKLCGSCHQDIRARFYLSSHHPVREGHMYCSDCHNPHGTDNPIPGMLRTEERLNDLCLSCHTRYQGPFVFEHEPVVENCTICHEPHGTIANNLLKKNEPFLCTECHNVHFHATKLGGWTRGMLTKCTQCHKYVHGSNLPSQPLSGNKALMR